MKKTHTRTTLLRIKLDTLFYSSYKKYHKSELKPHLAFPFFSPGRKCPALFFISAHPSVTGKMCIIQLLSA